MEVDKGYVGGILIRITTKSIKNFEISFDAKDIKIQFSKTGDSGLCVGKPSKRFLVTWGCWVMDQLSQCVSGRDQRSIDRFWRVWVKPPSMVPCKVGHEENIPTLIAYKWSSQRSIDRFWR